MTMVWLHYSNRAGRGELSQSEQQRLLQLTDDAQRMRERIQALEDILDAEHRAFARNGTLRHVRYVHIA